MGTYIVELSVFSSSPSLAVRGAGAGFNFYELTAENSSGTLVLAAFGAAYYLDGSAVGIPLSSLPAGFIPTSAAIRQIAGLYPLSSNAGVCLVDPASGTEVARITGTFGVFPVEITNANPAGADTYADFPDISTLNSAFKLTNSLQLLLETEWDGVGTTKPRVNVIGPCQIFGTYNIISGSFTIPTAQPVTVGDTVTINAASGLEDVTEIKFQYEDPISGDLVEIEVDYTWFIIWTDIEITFLLPSSFNGLNVEVLVYIQSTAFSGYAYIASLTVLVADASGIYKLVTNKSSDTIYTSHSTGTTSEIKIPDPFIKTGFVGG